MCGTGRFLIPFLEEGFNLESFDASPYMLEALQAKAKAKNLKPIAWQGMVENLKKAKKYNLIFIPSGSFCLMTDALKIKTVVKTLYDHLNDGGILLFEAETLKAIPPLDMWLGSVSHRSNNEMIVLSQLATVKNNICTSIGKYELFNDNLILHTEIEELKVKIYESLELKSILKNQVFKIRLIKAFDKNTSPDENDKSIVYECIK